MKKMKIFILLSSFILTIQIFVVPMLAVAQGDPFSRVCNSRTADSAACQSNTQSNPLLGPEGVITNVIQIIVLIVGIASVIVIIVAGLMYIISAGDSQKIAKAKDAIIYALIGLVVALLAQTIVSFVLTRI